MVQNFDQMTPGAFIVSFQNLEAFPIPIVEMTAVLKLPIFKHQMCF